MSSYSIDQFSQITGITKFVLRTWENRYGFLKAERTKTKIRFYTDDLLVRALNTNYLLENGIKISAVSKMTDEEISLEVYSIKNKVDHKALEIFYINKFIESALEFDSVGFHCTYKEGVETFGVFDFYKDVLLPTFSKVGVFWLTNRIAPSQEHFLSEMIKQKLLSAADTFSAIKPKKSNWLLFLPENEYHDIGLIFAKYLLLSKGYDVIYLGPNVPFGSMIQLSEKMKIDNVLFFSVSNQSKTNLDYTISYLQKTFSDASHHLVCDSVDESISKNHSINIMHTLDDFLNIVK
jgi:MerR family transcriptional regulator, light-induced transcriptional regulator